MFVRLEDNVVRERFAELPIFTPELMATIVPAPEDTEEGWVTTDGGQTFGPAAIPLADLKARRKDEVDSLYESKVASGVVYSGAAVPCDPDTQATFTGLLVQTIVLGGAFPGYVYRSPVDGNTVTLANAAAVGAMAQTLGAFVSALDAGKWTRKDAIDALTTVPDVLAYDITTGW